MGRPRFRLGVVLATPGALAALRRADRAPGPYLVRHAAGDWGDVGPEDRLENEYSLQGGLRLLSAYTLPGGAHIWIITEADRSATTILLPEEY